jgi:hypothetical protein
MFSIFAFGIATALSQLFQFHQLPNAGHFVAPRRHVVVALSLWLDPIRPQAERYMFLAPSARHRCRIASSKKSKLRRERHIGQMGRCRTYGAFGDSDLSIKIQHLRC